MEENSKTNDRKAIEDLNEEIARYSEFKKAMDELAGMTYKEYHDDEDVPVAELKEKVNEAVNRYMDLQSVSDRIAKSLMDLSTSDGEDDDVSEEMEFSNEFSSLIYDVKSIMIGKGIERVEKATGVKYFSLMPKTSDEYLGFRNIMEYAIMFLHRILSSIE